MKKVYVFILLASVFFSVYGYDITEIKRDIVDLSKDSILTDELKTQKSIQFESIMPRPQNSTADQGFYWDNGVKGRWAPFGAYYNTRLYYRKALSREANNFWHAGSALEFGIEQQVSSFSKTSIFLFYQPIIAFNVQVKIGYSKDFVKSALLTGPNDDYSHAFPPLTGLNPKDRQPKRVNLDTLELELIPIWTFGGKVGDGMLALIYSPHITYLHNFGIDKDQYIYQNRESIAIKGQDFFWRHDIKLGYSLSESGMSFALTGLIEQVQSISGIFRAGVFGSVAYEKSLTNYPNVVPFFRGQVGVWVKDRYMLRDFAMQIDTGIKWKFR